MGTHYLPVCLGLEAKWQWLAVGVAPRLDLLSPQDFRNTEDCRGPPVTGRGGTSLEAPPGTGAKEGIGRAHPDNSAPRIISPTLGHGAGGPKT